MVPRPRRKADIGADEANTKIESTPSQQARATLVYPADEIDPSNVHFFFGRGSVRMIIPALL
jgi:hypothetical protein